MGHGMGEMTEVGASQRPYGLALLRVGTVIQGWARSEGSVT